MNALQDENEPEDVEFPDLPEGWEWSGGESGNEYYTHWFNTKFDKGGRLAGWGRRLGGCSGQVYHDRGGKHHVEIVPIVGMEGDDPVYDYADVRGKYETKQEAINAVPRLIEKLYERSRE